ncbi:MAG: NAD(P)/FAD-dependent oxidoreductase [Methanomassiliicoccales archaeon]|nr:MAG: NAD(P)/FAD-dependent oxidoreductase [Methanomassiliicoccales archaeon]
MNDVVIVGAGPAGIAAGIYLKRAGFEPLVFEKEDIGGLLLNANFVENYPGFPEGIGGEDLAGLFKKQLSRLGIEVKRKEVIKISPQKGLFKLITDDDEIISQAVIMATGTTPKSIDIQGQTPLIGRKLFYEIKNIPPPKKGDIVMIIGGGDAAFDYALNIAKDVERVDIIYRSEKDKCLALLRERVKDRSNIHVHPTTKPLTVREEKEHVIVKCESQGKEIVFPSDYVLIACGRRPNLKVLSEDMVRDLSIGENGGTNIPGLFIAGDVKRGRYRQTGIAVGDGILCAMSVVDYLMGDERK